MGLVERAGETIGEGENRKLGTDFVVPVGTARLPVLKLSSSELSMDSGESGIWLF
jgi:hypothetical protein